MTGACINIISSQLDRLPIDVVSMSLCLFRTQTLSAARGHLWQHLSVILEMLCTVGAHDSNSLLRLVDHMIL